MYITPSGVRKNVLRVEDILKLEMTEEGLLQGSVKPSGEIKMHYLIQRASPETTSVLHVHPTHVVAAMYAGWSLPILSSQFPELHRYTRVAENVPVVPVTSKILADLTFKSLCGPSNSLMFDIVGQDRHGVCSVARDPWSAYEHVERLNHICEIVLASGVRPVS